jgi:3-methyladenine DNA glycosylase AlkC
MSKVSQDGQTAMSKIDSRRTKELEAGEPSTNLAEILSIDFTTLLRGVLGNAASLPRLDRKSGITRRMEAVGQWLHDNLDQQRDFSSLADHRSDTVRGWACYWQSNVADLAIGDRLRRNIRFADDLHFGVREWSWLSHRRYIASDLLSTLAELQRWTEQPSANLRRFAVEVTRPRGVWCVHIETLKHKPELGLNLLAALRSDPSRYVQDSVGNWLNDASKTRPDWVRSVCESWARKDSSAAAARVIRRALRTVGG